MRKIWKRPKKKPGLAPGTITSHSPALLETLHISVIDYDETDLIEKPDATIKDCLISLDTPEISWINVRGIADISTIQTLGSHFGIHSLILEDITTREQRAKIEDYLENIFIVIRSLKYDETTEEIKDEQVSLVFGKNYVITFCESNQNLFEPVHERILKQESKIRKRGTDYLSYALIDCLIDHYFLILEKMDEKLQKLEQELIDAPKTTTLLKIEQTKRDIIILRKAIWPMREVIGKFRKIESPLIQESTKLYLQDVYDHTIQIIDTIESFRDISSGMLDIYLSNISQRLNEIMKVLTIVSTLFVPLTFIASLFGMNFVDMPGLNHPWGFTLTMVLMGLVSIGMLYYFYRKQWL